MKSIRYKVDFYSLWHCGSGLAGGAEMDAFVLKDRRQLPYIPGKTIKGLIREALEEVICYTSGEHLKEYVLLSLGSETDKGVTYFTNAYLDAKEQEYIISNDLSDLLYRNISSTAIGQDGLAADHSLRVIECTVPCTLHGEIQDIPDELYEDYKLALQMIKGLGFKRNRGLGRCKFIITGYNER